MALVHRRSAERKKNPATSPGPVLVPRVKPLYRDLSREQVLQKLFGGSKGNWAVLPARWIPHVSRITRGNVERGLIDVIWLFTGGAQRDKGEQPPEWTPGLLPMDYGKILGFSERESREGLEGLIGRGYAKRKGPKGTDRYRVKLLPDKFADAPNAFDLREKSPDGEEPEGEEEAKGDDLDGEEPEGEEEAKGDDLSTTLKESRGGIPPRTIAPGATVALPDVGISYRQPDGQIAHKTFRGCRNHTKQPITIQVSLAKDGNAFLDVLPALVKPVEEAGRSAPDDLGPRLSELGFRLSHRDLAGVRRLVQTPQAFLIDELTKRVRRARDPLSTGLLPRITSEINERWTNLSAELRARYEAVEAGVCPNCHGTGYYRKRGGLCDGQEVRCHCGAAPEHTAGGGA